MKKLLLLSIVVFGLFSSAEVHQGPVPMPPQAGNSGKCLSTNGTILSWATCGGSSGANVTLSNLTNPTAINQNLTFNKSTPTISSGSSTPLVLSTNSGSDANTQLGLSGSLVSQNWGSNLPALIFGSSTADSSAVASSLIYNGAGGNFLVTTADSTTAGTPNLYVSTGSTSFINGASGALYLYTGVDGGGGTGGVRISSGNSTNSGGTGSISLITGTTSGARGKIVLEDGSEGTSGHVWTSTDGGGTGHWAAVTNPLPSPTPSGNPLVANGTTWVSSTRLVNNLGFGMAASNCHGLCQQNNGDNTDGNLTLYSSSGLKKFNIYVSNSDQFYLNLANATNYAMTQTSAGYVAIGGVGSPETGSSVLVNASNDNVQLSVKGNGTQTHNLQQWETSAPTVVAAISGTGVFNAKNYSANVPEPFPTPSPSGTYSPAWVGNTIVATGNSYSIVLPSATTNTVGDITITYSPAQAYGKVYTLYTTGGQTIGGVASGNWALYTPGESVTLTSDLTNWQVKQHFSKMALTSFGAISVVSTGGGSPSFGTTSINDVSMGRDGTDGIITYRMSQSVANGNDGSGSYEILLPGSVVMTSAITPDTANPGGAVITDTGAWAAVIPSMGCIVGAGNAWLYDAQAIAYDTTHFRVSSPGTPTTPNDWRSGAFQLSAGVITFYCTIRAPIVGWQP